MLRPLNLIRLSPVLAQLDGEPAHWCPGCHALHRIPVHRPNALGMEWTWNGHLTMPTFTPSVHLVGRCHYQLTEGRVTFLDDCAHRLAGQTVELPPIPEDFLR